jgi:hypothetical protein
LQIFFDEVNRKTILPKEMFSILRRLAEHPTSQEKEEELDSLAHEILMQCAMSHQY